MKECIILAGGLGTRLREVVSDVPKVMAEVAGKPFLSYLLDWCTIQSFDRVILSVGYLSEIIVEWVQSNKYSFEIQFVKEEEPLGTGGAIKLAMNFAKSEKAIIINGDTFFNVDIDRLYTFHSQRGAKISLALKPMVNFDRYGSVLLDQKDRITAFKEKQFCESGLINGGIYLIDKTIFTSASFSEKFSFEKEILEAGISELPIYGNIQDTYFIDIGIPEDYRKANVDFQRFHDL
ncbi:D-glycero-alpha-D-manno-heptose 1-phosphate guanylyltransferase [Dysgonomonas hofstadii]|uniref:D-glycero-alpha-D-manno-heptose 1-phosphate guanylyltransferase n=1 Tax=Dysgonomonas hofstadii TaxID=637886 RepID=A0A840CWD6_9BACT|nr:nucleotidyltransferase family protein [Dysgonomonas hofstadii]MBB4036143.1 D-glycero-alpha-D-manno-heptose 1-phosphate guanylyltransferase [Dysgonomonas hofstadii]